MQRRHVACVLFSASAVLLAGCGSSDAFPRDQFVKAVTAPGISKPVAECVYDKLVKDTETMQSVTDNGGPDGTLPSKTEEKLARFLRDCLLAAESSK
jgi:hypothetical protein